MDVKVYCRILYLRTLATPHAIRLSSLARKSSGPEIFPSLRSQQPRALPTINKMIISRRPLRPSDIRFETKSCLLCQWRTFSTSYRRLAEKPAEPPATPAASPNPLADAPRAYGKSVTEFTPKPLSRPIGMPNPPRPGENAGIDSRTWKQRRDDFVDYDKHLVKRKQLYVSLNPFEDRLGSSY